VRLRRKSKSEPGDDAAEASEASWVVDPEPAEPVAEEPVTDAADAASVEENAAAAFAAAGEPPPFTDPSPAWGDSLSAEGEPLTERPEALVGAAFAGGVLAALILKRLVR
jgi:hypothetical protein